MPRLFDERSAGAVVVDQAFQPVCSGRALQQVSGHAQRAKPGIDKAGQIPQLCVRSPDGIIKGHVVCNDGARADEFLDVAAQRVPKRVIITEALRDYLNEHEQLGS